MENSQDEARTQVAVVVCVLAALTTLLVLVRRKLVSLTPIPMRTLILSGQMWLDELLVGHPERFVEQFGMSKCAFQLLSRELQLHSGLTDRCHVTADEQLATFLYITKTGSSTRTLQECFQRSPSTITG